MQRSNALNRRLTFSAAAVAVAGLVATPMVAAKDPKGTYKVSRGATTLTVDATAGAVFTAAGTTVSALKPAKAVEGGFSFPVSTGRLKTATNFGTIKHTGGLSFVKGAVKLEARNIRAKIGQAPELSAMIGETRLVIATLDLSSATVDKTRTILTVTGAVVKLTKNAADALNAAFGTTFAEDQVLGTAGLRTRIIGKGAKNRGPKSQAQGKAKGKT